MNADTAPAESVAPPGWRRLEAKGFSELVGPVWFRKEEGGVRFGFRAEDRHANPNGVIHGGMLMYFADHVLGALAWHACGRRPCATLSMNCDFLAAARPGDWIEGNAEITRKGRAVIFIRGMLEKEGEAILTADSVWKVIGER